LVFTKAENRETNIWIARRWLKCNIFQVHLCLAKTWWCQCKCLSLHLCNLISCHLFLSNNRDNNLLLSNKDNNFQGTNMECIKIKIDIKIKTDKSTRATIIKWNIKKRKLKPIRIKLSTATKLKIKSKQLHKLRPVEILQLMKRSNKIWDHFWTCQNKIKGIF